MKLSCDLPAIDTPAKGGVCETVSTNSLTTRSGRLCLLRNPELKATKQSFARDSHLPLEPHAFFAATHRVRSYIYSSYLWSCELSALQFFFLCQWAQQRQSNFITIANLLSLLAAVLDGEPGPTAALHVFQLPLPPGRLPCRLALPRLRHCPGVQHRLRTISTYLDMCEPGVKLTPHCDCDVHNSACAACCMVPEQPQDPGKGLQLAQQDPGSVLGRCHSAWVLLGHTRGHISPS
jgi:hypothetical protein